MERRQACGLVHGGNLPHGGVPRPALEIVDYLAFTSIPFPNQTRLEFIGFLIPKLACIAPIVNWKIIFVYGCRCYKHDFGIDKFRSLC